MRNTTLLCSVHDWGGFTTGERWCHLMSLLVQIFRPSPALIEVPMRHTTPSVHYIWSPTVLERPWVCSYNFGFFSLFIRLSFHPSTVFTPFKSVSTPAGISPQTVNFKHHSQPTNCSWRTTGLRDVSCCGRSLLHCFSPGHMHTNLLSVSLLVSYFRDLCLHTCLVACLPSRRPWLEVSALRGCNPGDDT